MKSSEEEEEGKEEEEEEGGGRKEGWRRKKKEWKRRKKEWRSEEEEDRGREATGPLALSSEGTKTKRNGKKCIVVKNGRRVSVYNTFFSSVKK